LISEDPPVGRLTIIFDAYQTERNLDRAIVYNGADNFASPSPSVGGDGSWLQYPFRTTTGAAYIEFFSNGLVEYTGMVLRYQVIGKDISFF
jgi:hypothetical protein